MGRAWRIRIKREGIQREIVATRAALVAPLKRALSSTSTLAALDRELAKWRRKLRKLRRVAGTLTKRARQAASSRWHHRLARRRGTQLQPSGRVWLAIAIIHNGTGRCVKDGLLTIAACHSFLRRAARPTDTIIILTCSG